VKQLYFEIVFRASPGFWVSAVSAWLENQKHKMSDQGAPRCGLFDQGRDCIGKKITSRGYKISSGSCGTYYRMKPLRNAQRGFPVLA